VAAEAIKATNLLRVGCVNVWDSIERELGVDVRPSLRRSLRAEYTLAELREIAEALPQYLDSFAPAYRHSPNVIRALGIDLGLGGKR